MLPVCDVIPRRAAAWVTTASVGAVLVACAWAWTDPVLRPAVFLWMADAYAIFLAAPSTEDRLGSARFSVLVALGATASLIWARSWPGALSLPPGIAAACLAGHLALFPGSRLLAVSIGWPYGIHELPTHTVGLVWAVMRVGTWSLLSSGLTARWSLPTPLSLATAAAFGGVAALVLRRRDRESPAWWDLAGPAGQSNRGSQRASPA